MTSTPLDRYFRGIDIWQMNALKRLKETRELEQLLYRLCSVHSWTPRTVCSRLQTSEAVDMRRTFCRNAIDAGYSLSAVARFLKRHHTTVWNLVKHDGR